MPTISPSAVLDAVYDTLTSASEFSSGDVSKSDYEILARAPGACAMVVRFRGMSAEPITYGNPRGKSAVTTIEVEGFIRDTGDLSSLFAKQVQLAGAMWNVIHAGGDTLGGVAKKVNPDRVTVPPDLIVESGGFQWLPVILRIQAEQF